jgi:hypothetical protein
MPVRRAALPLLVLVLAPLAACERAERVPQAEEEEPVAEFLPPEVEPEPIDPLDPEVRRACGSIVTWWRGQPTSVVRAFDSVVVIPGVGTQRDACLVEAVIEDEVRPDDPGNPRSPLPAAGWLDVQEHWSGGPGARARIYQNDPVRCRVLEEWTGGGPADTLALLPPRFRQVTSCWRRGPVG